MTPEQEKAIRDEYKRLHPKRPCSNCQLTEEEKKELERLKNLYKK